MRFSFWPNPGHPWEELVRRAQHVERTGWDGIWFADHFMPAGGDVGQPVLECWSVLAGLAASVPRVRLGALVSGNTYRHPAVLTNVAAAVDQISGGRVVLGLGAGWQENEHRAYGIEFGTVGERLDRLEEACQVIVGLRDGDRADFAGKWYQLDDAPLAPAPAGSLPLLVGGGGEKRTMRIAARYADEWNVWGTPDVLRHKVEVLEKHCAEVNRDAGEIARSAQALLFMSEDESWVAKQKEAQIGRPSIVGTPAEVAAIVAEYRDAGVDELIVPDFTLGDFDSTARTLDLFMEKVAPGFRTE